MMESGDNKISKPLYIITGATLGVRIAVTGYHNCNKKEENTIQRLLEVE